MQEFSAWEYLLIDVANQYGHDKLTFDKRIEWAESALDVLENLSANEDWKEKPLYVKAVQAIRKAQQGIATGHVVGFDAVCSGMQIMSVLTGCIDGARATGLIDQNRRADAYTDCDEIMGRILGRKLDSQRAKVKNAVMTSLYGSKKEPKKEFGVDTPELDAFYHAMYELAPGACELLDDLLHSWNAFALTHEWKLPDGFDAKVKVMQKLDTQIEVDELNHHTFTFTYYENEGEERGVKNAANVVHSLDAYVLRSVIRRCSYDPDQAHDASVMITSELLSRATGDFDAKGHPTDETVRYYQDQYERSGLADAVIIPHLDWDAVECMSTKHLRELNQILCTMLEHRPFHVITVHDEFKCHPNYMNYLRKHYRNILAELAESRVLDDILSQLYGVPGTFEKKSPDLADKIRQSNYALC